MKLRILRKAIVITVLTKNPVEKRQERKLHTNKQTNATTNKQTNKHFFRSTQTARPSGVCLQTVSGGWAGSNIRGELPGETQATPEVKLWCGPA